jgi:hypothetical protein
MNKAEIISKTLRAMNLLTTEPKLPVNEGQDEEAFIISALQDVLPDGVDIRTCEDFCRLNVECCTTCHNFYPHYEMKLIVLPDGSPAWVCDKVLWAIYPDEYRKLREWSQNSSEGKLVTDIFGEMDE